MIDVNDLVLFKADKFQFDSHYYIKQDDGSFKMAITWKLEEWDKWPEEQRQMFRDGMKKMSLENRLYKRINKPGANFVNNG